jgi:hypothetical protein
VLDGQLRRLSFHRDGLTRADGPVDRDYGSVLRFINALNARWVEASQQLSPRVLTDLLETAGLQAAAFLASLPLHEPAFWPVAWAGEAQSENWMDVGRDYTECWHHQQQIRDAVGAPPLTAARWLAPVVALGVRALPRALADVTRPEGTAVGVAVRGEAGGRWRLVRARAQWELGAEDPARPGDAQVDLDAPDAARLWFSGRAPQAAATAERRGDPALCEAVLAARALMV